MTAVASPDARRSTEPVHGMYIRVFQIAADGTRYDDSGVITVTGELSPAALHPSAAWPPCACPRHREN